MIDARFVPIVQWPGEQRPAHRRTRATFSAGYSSTLTLIDRELSHLRAKDVLIQAFFRPEQIRLDGWPRSGEGPSAPGIILTFQDNKNAPFSFPCDTYLTWQHNLRAIGLAMDALRRIKRYGVGQTTEQYQGFLALPAASGLDSRMSAAIKLSKYSGVAAEPILMDPECRKNAIRLARAATHPDRSGDSNLFLEIQHAASIFG